MCYIDIYLFLEFETDLDSIATGSPVSLPNKQADPKEVETNLIL